MLLGLDPHLPPKCNPVDAVHRAETANPSRRDRPLRGRSRRLVETRGGMDPLIEGCGIPGMVIGVRIIVCSIRSIGSHVYL